MPSVARTAVRPQLGTFHDREARRPLRQATALQGRLGAGVRRQPPAELERRCSPTFNGSIVGVQPACRSSGGTIPTAKRTEPARSWATLPLPAASPASRSANRVFRSAASGSTSIGRPLLKHFWPAGGSLDAVLMQSWFTSSTNSVRNISRSSGGRMEPRRSRWAIPFPCGQMGDQPSAVHLPTFGRRHAERPLCAAYRREQRLSPAASVRLTGDLVRDKMVVEPFALVNLWHGFDGQDQSPSTGRPSSRTCR